MRKLSYFGGLGVIFALLLISARKFDVDWAEERRFDEMARCQEAVGEFEKKYIESIRGISGGDSTLASLVEEYSSSPSEKREIAFAGVSARGSALLARLDASNPAMRRLMDEAQGALNRRENLLQKCRQ